MAEIRDREGTMATNNVEDENAVYNPATQTGDTSASGNPGANNPGAGNLGAGDVGVIVDTDVARGFVNPGDVGSGASSTMGAGGMGTTGLLDHPPAETGESVEATGSTSAASPAGAAATENNAP